MVFTYKDSQSQKTGSPRNLLFSTVYMVNIVRRVDVMLGIFNNNKKVRKKRMAIIYHTKCEHMQISSQTEYPRIHWPLTYCNEEDNDSN